MTTDYVLDASAAVLALVGKSADAVAFRTRLRDIRSHAPHLIDAEIGNVLRRHELAGLITTAEANAALLASEVLVDHRYPHAGSLSSTAWQWRANLSFYDSLYLALAVRLGVSMLTADARLGRAPGAARHVELI